MKRFNYTTIIGTVILTRAELTNSMPAVARAIGCRNVSLAAELTSPKLNMADFFQAASAAGVTSSQVIREAEHVALVLSVNNWRLNSHPDEECDITKLILQKYRNVYQNGAKEFPSCGNECIMINTFHTEKEKMYSPLLAELLEM